MKSAPETLVIQVHTDLGRTCYEWHGAGAAKRQQEWARTGAETFDRMTRRGTL
jgi:hypothetical protein